MKRIITYKLDLDEVWAAFRMYMASQHGEEIDPDQFQLYEIKDRMMIVECDPDGSWNPEMRKQKR